MLIVSAAAAKIIVNIMVEQGLDPLRDVFEVAETDEGYSVSFTRDLTPTEVQHGLRVHYRGTPLAVDISPNGAPGLLFTPGA